MKIRSVLKYASLSLVGVGAVAGGLYHYAVTPHRSSAPPQSAQYLLDEADALAWGNLWLKAQPLYRTAEEMFTAETKPSKALYAHVSQIPPNESVDLATTIAGLSNDLGRPEAADPETRLRILTIRGMLETDFNAAEALPTWQAIGTLATSLHHYSLATRAMGEQGIAAFMLGDMQTAKNKVIKAWTLSKAEKDPAASVRYASVFGAGLVEIGRYKEALNPLDEAIKIAAAHPEVAYPSIAVYTKISALTGLGRLDEALALANKSLAYVEPTQMDGHKAQVLIYRGNTFREMGNWDAAVEDYRASIQISEKMSNFRGVADAGSLLAQAYEHNHDLVKALDAIDGAIAANTKIPAELYMVPRTLATKAQVLAMMGRVKDAETLYLNGVTLLDTMLQHAPTTNIERQVLADASNVYSGYFALLSEQKRYDDALRVLERIRGRVEAEALEHRVNLPAHAPSGEERELTRLNLELIRTNNPLDRETISHSIYMTELANNPSEAMRQTIYDPVTLKRLQTTLSQSELLLEYVLSAGNSYVLAITKTTVVPYALPSKDRIEGDARRYVGAIHSKKDDPGLAQTLFDELLAPVKEFDGKSDLVVVPDGALHMLPFAALAHNGKYVLSTHTVDVVPSATVFNILRLRTARQGGYVLPYLGVAAWTQPKDGRPAVVRAVSGPIRSELVPLPESKAEVENIAEDMPAPRTILLGKDATETNFKAFANNNIEVVHLALHGYVDLDYPDRSALAFAPEPSGANDGLLQVREIRGLHLSSKLVTLSACNTGVGPVGEAGVANLVNAFIEAGVQSVVSTLWDIEDQSTRHLMETFYVHLASHPRKIDALRAAQLDILERGYPAYFWAGVQLVGDPDGTL